jgi:hypothetical protein
VLGTEAEWWKTPIDPAPSTYRVWYKRADRSPLRLVFEAPIDRLAPFGRYALTLRTNFAPVARTGLAKVAALCAKAPPSAAGRGSGALMDRIEAMDRSPQRADSALERLMPALQSSCPAPERLRWPERLAMTGILTPFDAAEDPVPTEILYDWAVPGQRTRLFPPPQSRAAAQDALLLADGGYTVTYRPAGAPICSPGLPGAVRPDWPSRAPCECAAAIAAGTALTPDEPLRILSCPLALPRIAWAWYGLSGRPRLFMVTSVRRDAGAGDFAVLDYFRWSPQTRIPGSVFEKPAQCAAPRPTGANTSAPDPCFTCHSGTAAK